MLATTGRKKAAPKQLTTAQRLDSIIKSARVVSRMLWKFPGGALRAFEGSFFQAARSRGIGSIG